MNSPNSESYTAFDGNKLFAKGRLEEVVLKIKRTVKKLQTSSILIFNDSTGSTMDFDLTGTEKDVLRRLQIFVSHEDVAPTGGPGRPKLGVVAREVSLLPRHWEWLATQSGGASATLRRLVEEAKKQLGTKNQVTQAQERTHKFMSTLAGNLPGYEEALRALYRKDKRKFKNLIAEWPIDIREHAENLAEPTFGLE
jgi:hypothetical protein